jgi:oligopeptide/dipeptide ABC transporter ATP-binding protein
MTIVDGRGPAISVDRLSVMAGPAPVARPILQDVSFDVPSGGALAVIGETGSGKSTLVHCLMGLQHRSLRVTEGSLELFGRRFDPVGGSFPGRDVRGKLVAIVFQDAMSSFDPNARMAAQMAEIIRQHQPLSRREARATVLKSLASVGFRDAERVAAMWPFGLSGGMRQRAMIALARATGAPLLLCDEPTTALDPIHTREICELLLEDIAAGRTLILVTHDLRVAAAVCRQVAVLYRGTLVEIGPSERVLSSPRHPYTAQLIAAASGAGIAAPTCSGDAVTPEPTLSGGPSPCVFAPECPWHANACDASATVPWRTEGDGHRVRCVRSDVPAHHREGWWRDA